MTRDHQRLSLLRLLPIVLPLLRLNRLWLWRNIFVGAEGAGGLSVQAPYTEHTAAAAAAVVLQAREG
jgi:hypothetical protein